MAAWPATLPQKQFLGLTDKRRDARVRTEMDQGPPIMRRRYTAAYRDVNCPLIINGAQRQTFDTFYITTLKEGALSFTWEDPVTDTTVSFRFVQPPEWTLRRGGSTTNDRIWETSLELEIVP